MIILITSFSLILLIAFIFALIKIYRLKTKVTLKQKQNQIISHDLKVSLVTLHLAVDTLKEYIHCKSDKNESNEKLLSIQSVLEELGMSLKQSINKIVN